jgi:hypothetical protein
MQNEMRGMAKENKRKGEIMKIIEEVEVGESIYYNTQRI